MNDYSNRNRGDFDQRINQVRQEAEQLIRQARELKELTSGLREPSARADEPGWRFRDPPGGAGEGLYPPAGFPFVLDRLAGSLAELETWSGKIFGREEDWKNSLQELEIRSEEIAGLTSSFGETLATKTASLSRLTVLVREISAGRRTLKGDQEELAGAVNETVNLLERKEQGRRLLFDLAKTTLIQGEKKRDHLQEILTNQKTLSGHLDTCGKGLERTFALYEETPPGYKHFPEDLRDRATEFQTLVEELRRFNQGLKALEKIDLEPLIQGLRVWFQSRKAGSGKRPQPMTALNHGSVDDRLTPAPAPELTALLDTVQSLNEQMNLLSLNAFIASMQEGKKPEELAEVFGDIRVISDRLNMEILQFKEKGHRSVSVPVETSGANAGDEDEGPTVEEGEAILRELEALRPAFVQTGQAVQELGGVADRLLEHLRGISDQFQELALLVREQTRFAGRMLEGLLPLKDSLRQLKGLQADQDFQVQEINRSLQRTLVQAAPVRKWLADPGSGAGAPLARVESVREITRVLAGELFKQEQDEERLQQELERLRSLPEAVEQFVAGQSQKQLEFQEAVEKVRGDYLKMNRDLAVQQATLKTVVGQIRRLVENLEPFARDSREQSSMNRTLLEALTEIRSRIQEKGTG